MSPEKRLKKIIVTGDIIMDWNLARDLTEPGEQWRIDRCSRIWCQRGGAALQADLIHALITSLSEKDQVTYRLYQPATPEAPIQHRDPRYHHSHALWKPFKHGDRAVWRVQKYLGIDHCYLCIKVRFYTYFRCAHPVVRAFDSHTYRLMLGIIIVITFQLPYCPQPEPETMARHHGTPCYRHSGYRHHSFYWRLDREGPQLTYLPG